MHSKADVSLLLLFVVALLAGCERHGPELRLLTPALPIDQQIAADLVAVFEENSDQRIRLVPLPESYLTGLDALEAGYGDLALTSNAQPYRKGVSTIMPLYPTVLHVVYRRGRDASDPRALLKGAIVQAGPPGSSSRQMLERILTGLHLSTDDVTFDERGADLPDVFVLYLPLAPDEVMAAVQAFGADGNYEMLSFGVPEDIGAGSVIDRAVLMNPHSSAFVIPEGTYGDLTPEPVVTLAVDKLLVSRRDLLPATVYDLISEIRRLQPALAAKRPLLFQHLNEEFDASGSTFVLHPGAQAFTLRDEPSFYERYSGVAEVLVTLLIGVISGTYAVIQIYHRRLKNRIDVFYTEALAVRDAAAQTESADARARAVEDIRNLQNKAFAMLVDEKLAADDSFRIFITLSNDIIAELRKPRV